MDKQTSVTAAASLHAFVGACTIIMVWDASNLGLKIPDEIALAFQTVFSVGIHYLVTRGKEPTPNTPIPPAPPQDPAA